MGVTRGDVWLTPLDPTIGSEIKKTRPCMIISPPDIHDHLSTVIIAPMTTGGRALPFRIAIEFAGKRGLVLLDQIRAIDKVRLIRRLGRAPESVCGEVLHALQELFAE